jgi:hypothetical protein
VAAWPPWRAALRPAWRPCCAHHAQHGRPVRSCAADAAAGPAKELCPGRQRGAVLRDAEATAWGVFGGRPELCGAGASCACSTRACRTDNGSGKELMEPGATHSNSVSWCQRLGYHLPPGPLPREGQAAALQRAHLSGQGCVLIEGPLSWLYVWCACCCAPTGRT